MVTNSRYKGREHETMEGEGANPIVQLRDVCRSYQAGKQKIHVLKNINLTVEKGEFVGILGKSGSGKSTLLNIISGIDLPSSGTVNVKQQNILTMKKQQLSRWRGLNIGVVFQFFQLIPSLTLLENVMLPMEFCHYGKRRSRKYRAKELLKRLGLAKQMDQLPSSVSGGQKQRAAIARALANDPPILIADEPTGNLDSSTAQSILTIFNELINEDKTIIMVTHDLEQASKVTRLLTVSDGELSLNN